MKSRDYLPPIFFTGTIIILGYFLLPAGRLSNVTRAAVFASICGALVGVAEIASRYRDEPFNAIRSPYGLVYVILNGTLSFLAFFLIEHYSDSFQALGDRFLKALAAGFGAGAVMRTRLAILKGEGDKEISVGPDYVITVLLNMFDENIDRARARRRQTIVIDNLPKIRGLGSFKRAADYLLASLLAFQNMSEDEKKLLNEIISNYEDQPLPDDIKYLALGFVFLTLVGESHYGDVLDNAAKIQAGQGDNPPPVE